MADSARPREATPMTTTERETTTPTAEDLLGPPDRIVLPFFQTRERKWLLGLVDTCLVGGWLWLAYEFWRLVAHSTDIRLSHTPVDWIVGGSFVWLVLSWLAGNFELETADRFSSSARVTISVSVVAAVFGFAAYYTFLKTYPRPALALAVLAVPLSVLAWRAAYASFLGRPVLATRLLLVGNASLASSLYEATRTRPGQYRFLGYVSEHPGGGEHYLGTVSDLESLVSRLHAHRVVVAPRYSLPETLVSFLSRGIAHGLEVIDFNAAYEEIAGKVPVEHAGDYWLAALPTYPRVSALESLAMRLLDIFGATVGLCVTLVIGPPIALAVLLESGKPVIYRQQRLGMGGRVFTIYKFRSMRRDAEPSGPQWASHHDARVTRIGRLLRRTHLDELPQFWNVLRGEMSLVGPRPERPSLADALAGEIPFYRLRFTVRPGLTGLKQIRVGYAGSLDEQLEVLRHDLFYIKHRSIALNLIIMARTLGSVIGMKGR